MLLPRSLTSLLLGYAAVCFLVFLGQRRLLYFPDSSPPQPEQLGRHLVFWPSPGPDWRGFVTIPPHGANSAGLVVLFHGNAGGAWQRDYYARILPTLGFRVLLAEYAGYGGRPGSLSEKALVADARQTVELAHQQFGGPIYLGGESLGAAVAAAVAADPPVPVAGVIAITPWDSLTELAQSIYWFLPARWLLLDRYDNRANLNRFPGRVVIAMAEDDEIVPPRHSMKLYESLTSDKLLMVIPNSGHNSWPYAVDSLWWRQAMDFLSPPHQRRQ